MASNFEAAMAVIGTHLTAAGAALDPKADQVRRGEFHTAPNGRALAYWYDDEDESSSGGNTLTKVNREVVVAVAGYFPLAGDTDALAAAADAWIYAAVRQVSSRLHGDEHLDTDADTANNVIKLNVGSVEVGFWNFGGAVVRAFLVPVTLDLAEIEEIAE